MALGVDRDKFNRMVNFFRANIGGVLTLEPANLPVKNWAGSYVRPVRVRNNPDELEVMVKHYLSNYNSYPDEPLIEFNEQRTALYIMPSYNTLTK